MVDRTRTEHRANGADAVSDGADDPGERKIPLSVARRYAHEDPLLDSMIRKGLPLSRNAYLMLAYGPELPEGDAWNSEHEMGLPKPFQRPLNRPRIGRKPE